MIEKKPECFASCDAMVYMATVKMLQIIHIRGAFAYTVFCRACLSSSFICLRPTVLRYKENTAHRENILCESAAYAVSERWKRLS